MGWRDKKGTWFSPRAIQAPASRVEEVKTGPNSVRYQAKEPNRLETKIQNYGLSYDDYKKQKNKPKRNRYAQDDYGYSDEQVVHYNSPKYAWQPTRWATWGYGSFLSYGSDNDDSTLFVKEPSNYLTPTTTQIEARCSYHSMSDIQRIKELARVCYLKMIDDKDFIAEDYKDRDNCGITPESWEEKEKTYRNVYDTFIPGFTPLEQAIAFFYKLKDNESYNKRRKGVKNRGKSTVDFNRSDYSDAILNSQMDMNPLNKRERLTILNKISILGDFGSQFKVEKETGETEVANSIFIRKKLMRSYDQIRMIDMYQRIFPTFKLKFLTKDLVVSVPVCTSERKQKIIILIDFSGSMNQDEKQTWVNAILSDRLRYVIKGEAELFISLFTSTTSGLRFYHIKNEQDVKDFWMNFSNNPGGSLTDIGRIVNYVADQITVHHRLHNLNVDLSKELPEILIINDGQDEVRTNMFPYKVNAISLMQFSDELKGLCVTSGGKQIRINVDNIITAYSSNGEEVIAD